MSDIDQVQKNLLVGHPGRVIVGGSPKATDDLDEIMLTQTGVMGLWKVHPGQPAA